MTTEALAQALGAETGRRTWLKRAGAASVALVAGALGRTEAAEAHYYHYHGCHLCHVPASQGGRSCPDLRCSWCWWGECHGSGAGHENLCCEGYCWVCAGGCDQNCDGVYCSYLGQYSRSCR